MVNDDVRVKADNRNFGIECITALRDYFVLTLQTYTLYGHAWYNRMLRYVRTLKKIFELRPRDIVRGELNRHV